MNGAHCFKGIPFQSPRNDNILYTPRVLCYQVQTLFARTVVEHGLLNWYILAPVLKSILRNLREACNTTRNTQPSQTHGALESKSIHKKTHIPLFLTPSSTRQASSNSLKVNGRSLMVETRREKGPSWKERFDKTEVLLIRWAVFL